MVFFRFARLAGIFAKNALGCVNSPYITYRKLAFDPGNSRHALFVAGFAVLYFVFASLIRIGKSYPYILTLHFNVLVFSSLICFIVMVGTMYSIGRLLGSKGSLNTVAILWLYSLLPTISWFFLTSILYLLLPPPRTEALSGKVFSIVFLSLSLALLFWKLILYYLTLRFALRLDLFKIGIISGFILPVVFGLSIFFYSMRIFRIPFL